MCSGDEECNGALGVEDGSIGDESLRSSAHHAESSAAKYGRLNSQKGAGAWCHPSVNRGDRQQFFQVRVDLLFIPRKKIQLFLYIKTAYLYKKTDFY